MVNRRPVHPESPRTASFGPEQGTHTKHTMNTNTPTDLELLPSDVEGNYEITNYYMQNKPNLLSAKMNINSAITKDYDYEPPSHPPKTNPNAGTVFGPLSPASAKAGIQAPYSCLRTTNPQLRTLLPSDFCVYLFVQLFQTFGSALYSFLQFFRKFCCLLLLFPPKTPLIWAVQVK